jgi:dTDP-4-dehydrorhamnose reductase
VPGHVLIIGRTGQLATALARTLDGQVERLTILGRPELDLSNPASLREQILRLRPNAIVNAAAYTRVDDAEAEPEAAYVLNATGPGLAASAAAELRAAFVHVSTDYVFDGRLGRPYRETDETAPLNVYGASKLAGERAVAAANPNHVILRTSWLFSETGSNFVRTMLRLAETRDAIRVVDDQHGRPTYAPDLAEAIGAILPRLTASQDPELRGLFHYAGADDATWFSLASAVIDHAASRNGRPVAVTPIRSSDYPTPAARPMDTRLDCRRIEAAFGVSPRPWRESLSRCLAAIPAR